MKLPSGLVVHGVLGVALVTVTLPSMAVPSAAVLSGGWSAPVWVDRQGHLNAISCTEAGFCAAVDEYGSALTYDGHDWTGLSSVTHTRLVAVSCTSADFCAAVGNGYAYVYDGTSWDTGNRLHNGAQLTGVSCVGATFCLAVDRQGYAMTYDGSAWSEPNRFSNYSDWGIDVSCASTSFCVAVNDKWRAYVYNGKTWSAAQRLPRGPDFYPEPWWPYVSCPAVRHCLAVQSRSSFGGALRQWAVTLTRHGWSAPIVADATLRITGLSCAKINACTTINQGGEALSVDRSGWGDPQSIDPGHGGLTGISCTSGPCFAVDANGYALHQ